MQAHGNSPRGGFSLIELLAAVAILMMIVGMMAMLFGESNRSWTLGTNRAENNNAGRAALQLLTDDLQYAVADDVLTFALMEETTNTFGVDMEVDPSVKKELEDMQFGCDELRFVSLKHGSADGKRAAREVYYYVSDYFYRDTPFSNRFALMRGEYKKEVEKDTHCYKVRKWYDEVPRVPNHKSAVVAENVVGFAVYVPDPDPDAPKGNMVREYKSDEGPEVIIPGEGRFDPDTVTTQTLDRLPPFADVYLEVLDESAAKQLSDMLGRGITPREKGWLIDHATFIEKNSRRYTTRVFFHNRHGYQDALRLSRLRRTKQ